MTEFDPAVAHRILSEKQRRLDAEATACLGKFFVAQMEGHWYDQEFYRLDALYEAKRREANSLTDIVWWLKEQIEEESE